MKNRKDITDNELDELFKKASLSVNPEFEESSWQALEAKLDADFTERKFTFFNGRNILALLGIFLLVGLLTTNFLLEPKSSLKSDLNSKAIEEGQIGKLNEKSSARSGDETFSTDKNAGESESVILGKQPEMDYSKVAGNTIDDKKGSINLKDNKLGNKGQLKYSQSTGERSNVAKNSLFDEQISEMGAGKYTSSVQESVLSKESGVSSLKGIESLKIIQISPYEFDKTLNGKIGTIKSDVERIEIEPLAKQRNKLYLTLGVSPDFSKVLKNSFLKMGYNWSAQLEYHLSERWSLHSGIIISEKFYGSSVDGMFWPNNWGDMPKEMKGMEGSCKVIDIPLNIRYNLKYNDLSKMYVVGGISSFIMMSEQYEYLYPEGFNSEGMKSSWSTKDSGFLAAGMANFSIGYERKLGEVFSLQLEPFVKIPVRDFGFSQVKLATTGLFFSGKVRIK